MADDNDKFGTRAVDQVVFGSSSPTPAASSAGASSPAIPANMASVDWCGLGKGFKGYSRSGPQPPWSSGTSGSTGGGSLSQPVCRPWDRGDLLKRLSTFRSDIWHAAPKLCGPLACARRGWVSMEDDIVVCEACGAQIKFPLSALRPQNQVRAYAEQLDSGHKAVCPWKGNPCAESLAQFLTSPISALIGGFNDRCDALLQFSSLPIISGSAIDEMKITRGPEIDRILAKPVRETVRRLEDGFNQRHDLIAAANNPYFQAQRLISLCGWEPRFLPHVVDCEEHSAYSARKDKSVSPVEGPSHRLHEPNSLIRSRTTILEKRASALSDSKFNPASAVLDCSLCGASVSLKAYATASRPLTLGLMNIPEPPQKFLMRNASAASGVEGFHAPLKDKEDAGDAALLGEEKMSSYSGAVDLNLTVGGGGAGVFATEVRNVEVATGSQQFGGQLEGSEMGGPAASYESFGPGFAGRRMDEGGSTVDRPQSRMHRADSVEGTVLDFDGDEADDGEVGKRRSYVGESSKRKRGESSGTDQPLPFGDPGCSNFFYFENDYEVDDTERLKKRRREAILQELNKPRPITSAPPGSSVYASSVIAVDTCHSKQENSTESVENFPHDDDTQGAAFSWEKSERVGNDDFNYIEQAQQSTCYQGNAGDTNGGTGVSTSDEGDVDTAVENDAGCYGTTGGGMGHGLSLGMSGGSVQMGASHEAEIHGADQSVHKMESLANEITEVTDIRRQTSESVPGQALTGQSLPEDKKLLHANDNNLDSVETMPSLSVAKVYSNVKHEDSGQEESWEGKQKGSQGSLGDKLTEVNNTVNNLTGQSGANAKTVKPSPHSEGKRRGHRRTVNHSEEFDPVHEHQFYCPWVNGYVAAAVGSEELDFAQILCGWQLTADALDALQMQSSAFVAPMESESAASMHKGNGFVTNDITGRQSSSKRTVG